MSFAHTSMFQKQTDSLQQEYFVKQKKEIFRDFLFPFPSALHIPYQWDKNKLAEWQNQNKYFVLLLDLYYVVMINLVSEIPN